MTRRFDMWAKFSQVLGDYAARLGGQRSFWSIGHDRADASKSFPHPNTAERHVEQLIAEKTRKGYEEVAGAAADLGEKDNNVRRRVRMGSSALARSFVGSHLGAERLPR